MLAIPAVLIFDVVLFTIAASIDANNLPDVAYGQPFPVYAFIALLLIGVITIAVFVVAIIKTSVILFSKKKNANEI